jgi:hypothetical protein
MANDAANAARNPNPRVNGDAATCTGTTTNQGPAANTGSGSAALTNLHVMVVPGASVSGPIIGRASLDGTVISSGTIGGGQRGITATTYGVYANTATVTIPAPSLQFHRHPGSSLPNYRLSFFRPV